MVKKVILFKKNKSLKKCTDGVGGFFCDQNLLKNQMSFEDLSVSMEEEHAEKLGEATQEVEKQKTKKKKITSFVTFLINIGVVVAILLVQVFNSNVESFDTIIAKGNFKWQYGFVIMACFAVVMLLDTARSTMLLAQSSKKKRPFLCYKMNATGKYYDCITPMSTGGQPFQVFYLNKHGIDAGTSISIPIARYVIFQIAWTITSLFATIYAGKLGDTGALVSVASIVGFLLNFLMVVGVWLLSVSKRIGKVLVVKGIKLLKKMKIVKSYEKVYDKVMDTVNGFQSTMKVYTKNFKSFVVMILLAFVQFIANYAMPFFIYLMLGGVPTFEIFLKFWIFSVLVDLASGFIPLPGGTGMSEIGFIAVFTGVFPEGTVFWGLLLWRFMNYYIYLVQGLMILIYDYIWGNKKYKWQKRKWELEEESIKFKQDQLKKYTKTSKTRKIKI